MTATTTTSDVSKRAADLARRAKDASSAMATASTAQKNRALALIADELAGPARMAILEENDADVALAKSNGLAPALLDRLRLDEGRIAALSNAVREIIALPDPVGAIDGL